MPLTRLPGRWKTLIGVLVAAVIATMVAVTYTHGTSDATPPQETRHPLPIGFIDDTGAAQISLQLSPHQPGSAEFSLAVPHMGLLLAVAQLSPTTGGSVALTYRGPAELLTIATGLDKSHPSPPQTQPPQQKELTLEGVIDATARTAKLHLAVSSVQDTHTTRLDLIETPANRLTAQQALEHLIDALRTNDTAAVLAALPPGTVGPGEQQRLIQQLSHGNPLSVNLA